MPLCPPVARAPCTRWCLLACLCCARHRMPSAATELWWPQHAEPYLCLHRNPKTLRCVYAKSPMHQRSVSLSCHPHGRTRPATRARWRTRQSLPRHCGKDGRWKPCSRTQESDRTATPASAETEVRAGAVLSGGGPEPQATGAVSQPTDNAHRASRLVAEVRRKELGRRHPHRAKDTPITEFFNA